jgi:hypothetical protein
VQSFDCTAPQKGGMYMCPKNIAVMGLLSTCIMLLTGCGCLYEDPDLDAKCFQDEARVIISKED